MTPEKFRQIFVPKLADKYLRMADKVTITSAWGDMNATERARIQTAFENGRTKRAGEFIQQGRRNLAISLATTRVNEIIADGNLSIDLELDELL